MSPTTTPPHTGLLMPAMGHITHAQVMGLGQPSARSGPHMVPEQQYMVDSDRMLAHYLQFLEQSKAIPRYPGEREIERAAANKHQKLVTNELVCRLVLSG